jgi:GrpB-like predicted nucleotidyltransferase (UPF0157 family)
MASKPAPSTDEEIRAYTIDELKPLAAPILLVEHDPEWPERYQREAARIRSALGSRTLRVEHGGSTSVPGLAAKPIIDIILEVANSADEGTYAMALEKAGYVLHMREPEWHEHRMFKGPDTDINLHVYTIGCPEVDRMQAFRNWLRLNEADLKLYERAKRDLASRPRKYTQNYADAKSKVIEIIMARALSSEH